MAIGILPTGIGKPTDGHKIFTLRTPQAKTTSKATKTFVAQILLSYHKM